MVNSRNKTSEGGYESHKPSPYVFELSTSRPLTLAHALIVLSNAVSNFGAIQSGWYPLGVVLRSSFDNDVRRTVFRLGLGSIHTTGPLTAFSSPPPQERPGINPVSVRSQGDGDDLDRLEPRPDLRDEVAEAGARVAGAPGVDEETDDEIGRDCARREEGCEDEGADKGCEEYGCCVMGGLRGWVSVLSVGMEGARTEEEDNDEGA
jgi:hypothetical protein